MNVFPLSIRLILTDFLIFESLVMWHETKIKQHWSKYPFKVNNRGTIVMSKNVISVFLADFVAEKQTA